MERASGILMPVFSLPNEFGIGDFGKSSFNFIDFLSKSNQKIWQVLPLVQTGYGNSPYSSVASESFSPYYISPEILKEKGLISDEDLIFLYNSDKYVDYGFLYEVRFPMLKKAFSKFEKNSVDFLRYVNDKKSLDYALFMAIKYASGNRHFYEWEDGLRRRDKDALKRFYEEYKEEVLFWQFIQYEAESEWLAVKKYANDKGIEILGDMPLYVALDSVDVWVNPTLFKLDENFLPLKKAGVPPDYFCADGQLWGNPVYDYSAHEKQGFSWWKNRLSRLLSVFDLVRIDHFRGLHRYYEIDADKTTAREGVWVEVPSDALFSALHKSIDKSRIIAEDLGIIDDGVRLLMKKLGYPGMKILSFAFNGETNNPYSPQNVEENSVCYTGTHDNDTLLGLLDNASEWDYNNFKRGVKESADILGVPFLGEGKEDLISLTVNLGLKSKSKFFIAPVSDYLSFGSEYRINEPGTVKPQNWAVRYSFDSLSDTLSNKIKLLTEKYGR